MKKFLAVFIAAGLGLAAYAWAQITVPLVSSINSAQDLIQIIPGGQPTAGSRFATAGMVQGGTYTVKHATSLTDTLATGTGYLNYFANAQTDLLLEPVATQAYAYIYFASAPSDGARECFFSTATVTAAYPTATSSAQTINNAITAMTANVRYCYTYSLANTTWDRSN